jgi:predicted regulator of Ras-like GTPase activity (Roadblock/LC7/MglB family)
LQGCSAQQPPSFNYADFTSAKELPYDSPPQVIYRIDDHRLLTLEKYRDCNLGDTYYNDTKAGIREKIDRGTVENFQGRVINADPTGRNIVIPSADLPHIACSDRACNMFLFYSTDGGNTFHVLQYMKSFHPTDDSKNVSFVVTKDALYIAKKIQETTDTVSVDRYPLVAGYAYGQGKIPGDQKIEFNVKMPSSLLRSPSGQERFTCDASIKPTNPDAPLTRN